MSETFDLQLNIQRYDPENKKRWVQQYQIEAGPIQRFTDVLRRINRDQGVYRCHTSKACSHVCPKNIDVAHFIALVKQGKFAPA